MSDSHQNDDANAKAEVIGTSHGKTSVRRLALVTIVMVEFAVLAWGMVLFDKGLGEMLIPVWLTLTLTAVVVSMWFARNLLTAERNRDSETVAPVHSPSH